MTFPSRTVLLAAGVLLLAAVGRDAWAGGMLVSNRDRTLAINAWGGASVGVTLRLHNACRNTNADCSWTYRGGMIYSDRDPNLVIRPAVAKDGSHLILDSGCNRTRRECTWTYRDGMFISGVDPNLAIMAAGGARHGTTLRISRDCRASNPDCTWSR